MFGPEVVARWQSDAELGELAVNARVSFGYRSLTGALARLTFSAGKLVSAPDPANTATDFDVVLPEEAWKDLTSPLPRPGKQSVLGYLVPGEGGVIDGDQQSFAQNLQLVRRTVELARPMPTDSPVVPQTPELSAIAGSYVRVHTPEFGSCDIYVERTGSGDPILLLATAGSDSRQYHGLMTDALMTGYELIAVDLPWHGKSDPSSGSRNTAYRLDSARYVGVIVALIEALGLRRPVILGSSMAGAIVIEVAARAPNAIAGAIGAQVGPRVANRRSEWARSPRVNQTLFAAEWTYGLMSPLSPKMWRDRVWWGYSQGGFGVYDADLGYYVDSWDIDNIADLLDGSVPIVLLSGIWDYSVPPERTRELAASIPGALFREMPELGHFPHAENPPIFREHLIWALDRVRTATSAKEQL